jgi:RNA polymerase sigma-70 factor (ECF subfamily)
MDPTDAELIGCSRSGDRNAFTVLMGRWKDRAYALAYRLTGNSTDSDDICQLVMVRAWQGIPAFAGQASFATWLYRMTINAFRDQQRSRLARIKVLKRWWIARSNNGSNSPVHASDLDDTRERVGRAVAGLPMAIREAVVMRHYHELTFDEIAQVVGAPASTVKSRVAQGLRLLHHSLEVAQ